MPGNTAAAASGWALDVGSAYVGQFQASAETVVIAWEFNFVGVGLWVTADGAEVAAVGGKNSLYFPPTSEATGTSAGEAVIEHIQAIPNSNVVNGVATYSNGGDGVADQSESAGWTALSGMTGLHLWNVAPNWLSFLPDCGATPVSGHVTVTFQ